jgi:hypothetical protein
MSASLTRHVDWPLRAPKTRVDARLSVRQQLWMSYPHHPADEPQVQVVHEKTNCDGAAFSLLRPSSITVEPADVLFHDFAREAAVRANVWGSPEPVSHRVRRLTPCSSPTRWLVLELKIQRAHDGRGRSYVPSPHPTKSHRFGFPCHSPRSW